MIRVGFEHLKLFKDIVQNRSISRGAQLNGISQSAASQHLGEVERSLEVKLLDRSTRPLTLTAAGRLYYEMCRDVLRRREELNSSLGRLKSQVEGSVRLASIYSVGLSEMSRLETEFARRFPQAHLHVEYLRPEKVFEAVLNDQADLGLVSYAEATKEITVIPWRDEEMVVAASPRHPLATLAVVRAGDLHERDFIGFDEDLPIRREVDRFLRERGAAVSVVMHFDNIQMVKEAVALGSGVSILPARSLRAEIDQGRLVSIPLEAPGLCRPVGIIHRRRQKFTRAVAAFLDLLEAKPVAC
ncbi:MAG: LysR family transcriptional regulator [Acidobacteria bacterium]|nr:LysR family transcriptional regulator [Acidobacteriota bacterium]